MQPSEAFHRAARRYLLRRHLLSLSMAITMTLPLAGLTGCGPIEYVNQVTRKASSEVDAAKSVRADKHAPYWYTLAIEYLNKAREEAAAADFQSANLFGRRSAKAARKARSIAIERARDPEAVSIPEPVEEEIELVDPTSDEARADVEDNPLSSSDDETETP